tara:strand:- start:996 stop:2207 length:1212 start_codon:yes stop_codon:yes gene_type:complete
MELRDYQINNAKLGCKILKELGLVYFAFQVRTGKTLTSLQTAQNYGAKNVLFLTKKKAIKSIEEDYKNFGFTFNLTVINYESLHKVTDTFDLIILDENHGNAAFPKPSKRTREIKLRYSRLPMIMLSGTPAAESPSQWYHQFWLSINSPFKEWPTFYKWAAVFVNIELKNLGYANVKDYTKGKEELINKYIKPYVLTFSQEEAGFSSKVDIEVLNIDPINQNLIKRLKKDKFIEGKEEVILADTGAKLMQKIHQLENGTIKFESGNSQILDYSKAEFIKEKFKGKKIAIFYYYKEELVLLKSVFKHHTTDLTEFNTSDKVYIGQQHSNALGVNLSKADYLVFYNFSFSGTNFIQSIDRLSTVNRLENKVYFVFPKGSLTEKIYRVVQKKKTFTEKMFLNQYNE